MKRRRLIERTRLPKLPGIAAPYGRAPLSFLFLAVGFFAFVLIRPAPADAGLPGIGTTGQAQGENTSIAGGRFTLAAGTRLHLRLETPVSTTDSHLHETVRASVVREVANPEGVVIPLNSELQGELDKVIPSSNPTDRARIRMRFSELEMPGQSAVKLAGHVVEVENARETILSDGTVQGVLASELPLSHLETALGKLGPGTGDLAKYKDKALGRTDTSINFPVGTDFVFVLDKPLSLSAVFPRAASQELSAGDDAAVRKLLGDAPQRAASKDGQPGDPINLVLIGNADEIRRAYQDAGWSEAEVKTGKSIWETIRAVAADKGYGSAPVSQLYVYGRPEDLAFEKMLDTFMKRHHLRLWRSPVKTPGGREIWLGAATHDVGLDVRPGVVSHAIDPDLDDERSKVGADLLATGLVTTEQLVNRPNPLSEGLTATGAPWKTDGRLLVIELKPQ